jgi:uncharacterized membrane protein
MGTVVFLSLRVVHVLLAVAWMGGLIFNAVMLLPVVESVGPAGGQIMLGLERRGVTAYFASIGGITVLTGFYLYWHFTSFDPVISRSNAGLAFGIGGLAGLLALIIGGAVVARAVKKIGAVMGQVAKAADAQKPALLQEAAALRGRVKSASTLVLALQLIALVLMTIGHYI